MSGWSLPSMRSQAGEGAAVEGFSPGEVALGAEEKGEIVQGRERVGMFETEHAFLAGEGAAQQGFGAFQVALRIQEVNQVVHAVEGVGVVGAEHALEARQRAAQQRFGLAHFAVGIEPAGQVVHAGQRVRWSGPRRDSHSARAWRRTGPAFSRSPWFNRAEPR